MIYFDRFRLSRVHLKNKILQLYTVYEYSYVCFWTCASTDRFYSLIFSPLKLFFSCKGRKLLTVAFMQQLCLRNLTTFGSVGLFVCLSVSNVTQQVMNRLWWNFMEGSGVVKGLNTPCEDDLSSFLSISIVRWHLYGHYCADWVSLL